MESVRPRRDRPDREGSRRRASTSTTSTSRAMRSSRAAPTNTGRGASPKGHEPTVYAHVVADPAHPGKLALQYWLFYAYNDWNNLHEGDWEMIQLDFDANDAHQALSKQPVGGRLQPARRRREGRLGRRQAQARRRHASGRLPGGRLPRELLRRGALPRQLCGAGRRLRQHHAGRTSTCARRWPRSPATPAARSPTFPWIGFQGRWGELQPAFFNGPTGPNLKSQWTEPIEWSQGWRDQSFTRARPEARSGRRRPTSSAARSAAARGP